MAAATKKRKEKKKLTLGRLVLVTGTANLKQSILETFTIYGSSGAPYCASLSW